MEATTLNPATSVAKTGPNWRQVGAFLILTFGLTLLLDLFLYLTIGRGQQAGTTMLLQVQMLIPAAVAIALQLFAFRDSPIYRLRERPRWFFYYYLAFSLLFALLAVSVVFVPNVIYATLVSILSLVLSIGALALAFVLRLVSGKEEFRRAGLSGGKVWQWLVFGVALVAIYAVMTGLNALFGLGQVVDVKEFLAQAAGGQATGLEQLPAIAILALSGIQSVLIAPFLGLLFGFGEEYGWRGFLQGELIKMGKIPGILLLGAIWGLWHAPIVMLGHNYPGYPLLGVLVMTLQTIAVGFFLGYAMLKTGSVWLVAFLHTLNNAAASFLLVLVYRPGDSVYSFGIGLYGLVVWAVVIAGLFIFDRKTWSTPPEPVVAGSVAAETG